MGTTEKAKKYKAEPDKLRIEQFKMIEILPVDKFDAAESIDSGILYRYKLADGQIMVAGRCPFCGVIGVWRDVVLTGTNKTPTAFGRSLHGGDTGKLKQMDCNCPACGHKWLVDKGSVVKI